MFGTKEFQDMQNKDMSKLGGISEQQKSIDDQIDKNMQMKEIS